MPALADPVIHQLGHWEVDLGRRELRASGRRVPLGGKAFDILEVLIETPGALITKDELIRRVWSGRSIDDNALQVHIFAIRKAFGADRALIKTTSGRGYRLIGEWQAGSGAPTVDAGDVSPDRVMPEPARHAPMGPAQDNLPIAMSELIGRKDAERAVAALLSAHRVVTMVGPGGIGKTRLAVAVANDQRPNFPDGVWFADLSPLSDPRLVPSVIASAFGSDLGVGDRGSMTVARAIGGRRCLIVLDNCEHVIDAAAEAAETIVYNCRDVSILATSREPLRIDAEAVFRVASLDLPPDGPVAAAELLRHGAVRLFLARAGASRFSQTEQPAELETVAAICRRLDGIPLAIELAAATASTLGLEATVRLLDDRFQLLTGGRRTAPPRQRTLRATLDWSHDLLSETEQVILRRLAVFTGGFTLDAACAVVATPDLARGTIIEGIAGLATKSLIATLDTSTVTIHSLLETVRAYALGKLAASGETETIVRQHATHYASVLRQAQTDLVNWSVQDWRGTYRRDIDNVRTALGWAFSARGDPDLAIRLSVAAIPLMFDLSLASELDRHVEAALLLIESGIQPDPQAELHLLIAQRATRVYTEGPSAAGLAAWDKVLQLATAQNDVACRLRALWGLWNDNIYAGTPAAGLAFAQRFMDLAVTLDDPIKVVLAHRIIGISLHYLGDQPAARRHLMQVVEHYVRAAHLVHVIGSRLDHLTVTRATLARVLWQQGEADEALRLSELALADALADDHLMSILYVLVEAFIPLTIARGDYAEAERYIDILLERAVRSGFRIWEICGRCYRGVLRVRQVGRRADPRPLIDAIRELREIGYCVHLPVFLAALATGQAAAGRTEEALAAIDEALAFSAHGGLIWFDTELMRVKAGIVLRDAEAKAEAESLLRRAMDLARRQGALAYELRATMDLAQLLLKRGEGEQARAMLAPVCARFTEGFGTADFVAARALLEGG
jgi:predicted ATPase/DNA-binding winged helix-turn-helix (wHTH) protein